MNRIFSAVAGIILLFSACTGSRAIPEIRQSMLVSVDTLWSEFQQVKKMFGYKTAEISDRAHEMDSILQRLKFARPGDISSEEQGLVAQYSSISRIYRGFGKRYTDELVEAEELFFTLKSIDKQVKAGDFDSRPAEFGTEYRKLRQSLNELKAETAETTGKITAVEPSFQRIAPKVDEIARRLK